MPIKLISITLFVYMLFAAAACWAVEKNEQVNVLLAGKPVRFIVQPFSTKEQIVYIPVDIVRLMGCSYQPDSNGHTVTITNQDGREITASYLFVKDRFCIAFSNYANALNADVSWDSRTRTYSIAPILKSIKLDLAVLTLETSFPAEYIINAIDNPWRIYIDLKGVSLPKNLMPELARSNPNILKVRTGIMENNVTRVTHEGEGANARLTRVTHEGEGANARLTRVVLDLVRPMAYAVMTSTNANCINIALTQPQMASRGNYSRDPFAGDMDNSEDIDNSLPPPQNEIIPILPKNIKGITIVVDPGHGGDLTGAVADNEVKEEDITLQIGLKLRDILVSRGINVIMTRQSNVDISLPERSNIANASKADLFVSIHCDAFGGHNEHTGATIYTHDISRFRTTIAGKIEKELVPRSSGLAECIASKMGVDNAIPFRGTRKDIEVRTNKGYAVLRNTYCPAVLIECGFINNDNDQEKLLDPDYQTQLCNQITAGIVDYINQTSSEK